LKCLLILVPVALALGSSAAEERLPEGNAGLAAKYPGDRGIDRDPAVVFHEDFEAGSLAALKPKWSDIGGKGTLKIAAGTPDGSSGRHCLQITATRGRDSGGHLFARFRGLDQAYMRYYAKFAADCGYTHHFVRLRAMANGPRWPEGNADKKPDPKCAGGVLEPDAWSTGFPPPGEWTLGTHWMDMRSWQGPGGTSFYPDNFTSKPPVRVVRDRWICLEVMMKMNSAPGKSDGEQAYWIDGKLAGHWGPGTVKGRWRRDKYIIDDAGTPFEGFRFRRDASLKFTRLWLLLYVSEEVFKRTEKYARAHPDYRVSTGKAGVLLDNIVVAGDYIGPVKQKE